ncbi:hypothetical protein [Alkalibacillus aidingensis]|uniref:hypothetical protein n=1 Tax=Alkalibacillus aidingensis TaxID=2747607 RepID=UPI001660AF4A|nr:hypothetical protein [Alkalibacillus aidingensis]
MIWSDFISFHFIFWGYGFLFTAISCGFYIYDLVNMPLRNPPKIKRTFKFLFSISTGWILIFVILMVPGLMRNIVENPITAITSWLMLNIFPLLFFIGFNMFLYGFFEEEETITS